MASKSDFAQKLLHDLKLRKEKMAATQSSSRDSRGFQGNASHSYRDARKAQSQLELSKSSSRMGNNTTSSKRSNGNSRSISTEASSNQVILYERGGSKSSVSSSSSSVKDLSMAIAFAFENNGNLSKIAVRSSNPLVNFFNRFSGRSSSRDSKRSRELTSVANNSTRGVTTYEFSNVSPAHIDEISKGIQKLNQILRACSNGVDLDKNSIEVGKELLRGAKELEESLKMLAKFQQGSDSAGRVEKSSRIRLLEEEEEDGDDRGDSRKKDVDRPRFSFDKPSSRAKSRPNQQLLMLPYFDGAHAKQIFNESKAIPHSRSSSCVSDFDGCSPSHSVKERAKISNVIVKLMGLEELPQNVKKDSSLERKEKNVSIRKSDEVSDDLFIGNSKIGIKPVVKSEEKPERGLSQRSSHTMDLETNTVPKLRRNTISIESKQSSVEGRERKVTETRENKVRVPNEHKALVDGEKPKDVRVGRKMINADKRKVTVDAARNQQLALEKPVPNEAQLLTKPKGSQVKSDSKPKVKQSHQKHNLIERRQKENQMESLKIEQGSQNLPKKQNHDKLTQEKGSEEISHNAASDHEKSSKQDHNLISGPREQSKDNEKGNNGISLEKHFDQLASKKKTISKEFQKKENPRKIDVLLTRRNRATNHPTTSLKHSANMFQDLKQRVNKKNISMKRTEQPSQNQENTEVVDIIPMPDSAEEGREETTQQDTSHKEAAETILTDDSVRDDKRDDVSSDHEQVCEALVSSLDQPYASMDEREFKQLDRNSEDHKESVNAAHNKPHHEHKELSSASWIKEPLTEPEKDFKEVIIKDQLFLNTAEALFKLNLPVTFLQTQDQNGEAFSDKKLLLDCGYEVMKRKAMRHGYSLHPFQRNVVSHTKAGSLDDLVKQLCRDFDTLKYYGGDWNNDEQNIANCLHRMLEKDIRGKHLDVNCMWDKKWNTIKTIFTEMEDVVRDVEKLMLNGLLDDITNDLVPVIVAV